MINSVASFTTEHTKGERVNGPRFDTDEEVWNSTFHAPLGEIVKEEREAWLAQFPVKRIKQQANLKYQIPYTMKTDLCEAATDVRSQDERDGSSSREAEYQTSTNIECKNSCTTNPKKKGNMQDRLIDGVRNDGKTNSLGGLEQESVRESGLPRASRFTEGTMKKGSNGVASSWKTDTTDALEMPICVTDLRDISYEETPTSKFTICDYPGTASSIDINEFKPLPPTNSTFKATVKRFSRPSNHLDQTLKFVDLSHDVAASKSCTERVHKSMSRWKLFGNSASDNDSNMKRVVPHVKKGRCVETARTMHTSKPFERRKLRAESKVQGNTMLKEPKLKAEIAYAAQFGTVYKKPNQTSRSSRSLTTSPDLSNHSKIRWKASPTTTVAQKLRNNRLIDDSEEHNSETASIDQTTGVYASLSSTDNVHQHCQKNFHCSEPSLPAITNRIKRASRAELEKENQQLRCLLRERLNRYANGRNLSNHDCHDVTTKYPFKGGTNKVNGSVRTSSNWTVYGNLITVADNTRPMSGSKQLNNDDGTFSAEPADAENDGAFRIHPLLTSLPTTDHQKILCVTNANRSQAPETSSLKRSTLTQPHDRST